MSKLTTYFLEKIIGVKLVFLRKIKKDKKIAFKPLHLLEKERDVVIGGGHDKHSDHCNGGVGVG